MTIKKIVIEGFKSYKDRTEVELGDLTILSGSNSSGKSTIMQSILLMKQTLEASFDPGPLLLNGTNVLFSNAEQMFWNSPSDKKELFSIGFYIDDQVTRGYEVTFQKQKNRTVPLQIVEGKWIIGGETLIVSSTFSQEKSQEFIDSFRANDDLKMLPDFFEKSLYTAEVYEDRFFINWRVILKSKETEQLIGYLSRGLLSNFKDQSLLEDAVRSIIHVPGLRGNPRRTYQVSAVEEHFPGLFPDYVASVIAYWQNANPAKVTQLCQDLKELGLAWNVKARKISDTEVEIQVARLPKSQQHGARDLVSIADVGFGMSQSLPVAVALLAAEPGELVYLEQPEIHLHPRAIYKMGQLIQRAIMRGVQVVVETHSEILLIALQEIKASKKFGKKHIIIHWVQRDNTGASIIKSQELDTNGAFGDVPLDFGFVRLEAIANYLDASGQG